MSILKPGTLCVIIAGCPENIGMIVEVVQRYGECHGYTDAYLIRTTTGRPFHQLWSGDDLLKNAAQEAITVRHKLRPLIDIDGSPETNDIYEENLEKITKIFEGNCKFRFDINILVDLERIYMRSYEIIVTAPQTVEVPEMYHSVSKDGEELLHIPLEAEEKIARRRRMYLLAFHTAMKTMELQNIPPSEAEWESCKKAYEILQKIANLTYQLDQLKGRCDSVDPYVEIDP
jgi:hypothetical protein